MTQNLQQLELILENIRIELNVLKNRQTFNIIVENGLRGLEAVSNYSGYDVDGLTNELMQDPEFRNDLNQLSCEIDLSNYISAKTCVLLKVIKTAYQKHESNKVKKQMNDVLNNNDLLNKIKNLEKK